MSRRRHPSRALLALLAVAATTVTIESTHQTIARADVFAVPLRQIGAPGHAELYGWGMATMPDGSVLIGDYWNFRIAHYATDGTFLGDVVTPANAGLNPTQHLSPYGIAVDPATNHVYFGDVDNNDTVDEYTLGGQYLREWGGKGTTVGKFQYPSYLAWSETSNRLYVADQWGHNVVAHDPNGTELFQFGTQGTGNGQFRQPRGLAIDGDNRLFVVDNYNLRVQIFSADGAYISKWGSKGTNPGQFAPGADLRGIAIDRVNKWVYVVDAASGFINKYDLNGNYLLRFGEFGNADGQFIGGGRSVTVDGDGNVWVGDMPGFRAQKFASDGTFLLAVPSPAAPPEDGGFTQPRGVAVDTHGNIFVSDTNNWRIEKFAPDGTFTKSWGHRNGGDGDNFNYGHDIAVDPRDDSVLVVDTDNHYLKRFTNDGDLLASYGGFGTAPGQLANPNRAVIGPDGKIYVTDQNNFRIQVLSPTGAPLLAFGTKGSGAGQFQFPRGIALDPDGSIWVTDSVRGIVEHFSSAGAFLGQFGAIGSNDNQLKRPDGIRVDGTYAYIADSDTDKIKVWSKSGTFVGAFGGTGSALGQFQRPHGLDMTPDGHLWVVEQAGERVQELSVSFGAPDTTMPVGTVTTPTQGQTFVTGSNVVASGMLTDNAVVGGVQIGIKNNATGQYWHTDGTFGAFQWQNAVLAQPGTTSSSWSYSWPQPSAGAYTFLVKFRDAAGNSPANKSIGFNVSATPPDTTMPQGTVTTPAPNQAFTFGSTVTATGGATDNVAVSAVQVAVKNVTTGLFWHTDGTFGAVQWQTATLGSPGATSSSWTYGWLPTSTGNFGFQVRFKDAAGNTSASVFRGFRVQ